MATRIRNIKGTFDILPYREELDGAAVPAVHEWQFVEDTIQRISARYGFSEIRTPILEPTALISRGIGEHTDIVSKEMFAFERGSTHYVLRPEVTAPVMRAYLQHHMAQKSTVQKLFYIGPCFRAERPQKGRYRQFHQFGAEVIGSDSPRADAETIALMVTLYDAFGIKDVRLRLNSLGDETSRPRYKEALRQYLKPFVAELSETSRTRLEKNPLRILDTKSPSEQELLKNAPLLADFLDDESRDHLGLVKTLLDDLGVSYTMDPYLVRGLDYYTRTAFELESGALGAQNALAGGGRYDLLAKEIGSSGRVPAVGFAAGIERLLMAIEADGVEIPEPRRPDLFVIAIGADSERWTFGTAEQLRSKGLHVVLDLSGRSLKAQMREANKQQARHTMIVGPDELESREVKLKRMVDGEEFAVAIGEADKMIESLVEHVSTTE